MLKVIILSLFLASLSPKPTDTTDLQDTWAFKTSGKAIPVFLPVAIMKSGRLSHILRPEGREKMCR